MPRPDLNISTNFGAPHFQNLEAFWQRPITKAQSRRGNRSVALPEPGNLSGCYTPGARPKNLSHFRHNMLKEQARPVDLRALIPRGNFVNLEVKNSVKLKLSNRAPLSLRTGQKMRLKV